MSKERRSPGERRRLGDSVVERITGRGVRRGVGPGDRFFHRFGIQDPYAIPDVGSDRVDRHAANDTGAFTYLSAEGYRRDVRSVRYHLLERLSHERTSRRVGERLERVGPLAAESGLAAPRLLGPSPDDLVTLVDTPTIVEVPVDVATGRPARTSVRERSGRQPRKGVRAAAAAPTREAPPRLPAGNTPAPSAPRRTARPIALATRAVRRVAQSSEAARLLRALLDVSRGNRRAQVSELLELVERGDAAVPESQVRELVARTPASSRARLRASDEPVAAERAGLRRVTADSPSIRVLERRAPDPVFAELEPNVRDAAPAVASSPRRAARGRSRAAATTAVATRAAARELPRRGVAPTSRVAERAPLPAVAPRVASQLRRRSAPLTAGAVRRAVAPSVAIAPDRASLAERREARAARADVGRVDARRAAPLATSVAPTTARLERRAVVTPWSHAAPVAFEAPVEAPATVRALRRLAVPAEGRALAAAPMAYVASERQVVEHADASPVRTARASDPAPRRKVDGKRAPAPRTTTRKVRHAAPVATPRPAAFRASASVVDAVTGRIVARSSAPASSRPAARAAVRGEVVAAVDSSGRRELLPRPAAYVTAAETIEGGRWVAPAAPVAPETRVSRLARTSEPTLPSRARSEDAGVTAEAAPLGAVARAAVRAESVSRVDRVGRPLAAPVAVAPAAPRLLDRVFAAPEVSSAKAEADTASPTEARPPLARGKRPVRAARQGTQAAKVAARAATPSAVARTVAPRKVVASAPLTRASTRSERAPAVSTSLLRPRRADAPAATLVAPGVVAHSAPDDAAERMSPVVRAAVRDQVAVDSSGPSRLRAVPSAVGPTYESRASRRAVALDRPQILVTRSVDAPVAESAPAARTVRAAAGARRVESRRSAVAESSVASTASTVSRAAARGIVAPSTDTVVARALPTLDLSRLLATLGAPEARTPYRDDAPDRVPAARAAGRRSAVGEGPVAARATRWGNTTSEAAAPRRARTAPDVVLPTGRAEAPAFDEVGSERRVRAAVHAALRTQRPATLTEGTRRVVQTVTPPSGVRVRPSRRPSVVEARVVQTADGRFEVVEAVRTTDGGRRAVPFTLATPPARRAQVSEPASRWAERRADGRGTAAGRSVRRAVEARPLRAAADVDGAVLPVGLGPASLAEAVAEPTVGGRRSLASSLADLQAPRRVAGRRRAGERRQRRVGGRAPTLVGPELGDEPVADVDAAPEERSGARDRQWARRSSPDGQLVVPDRAAMAEARQEEREGASPRAGGSLLTALARSGDPEEVVRVILERSSSVASAAGSLGAEARSLVDRIVRTAGVEREQRVSAQVAALPQVRTVNRRILAPASSQTFGGSRGSGGPTSTPTQGVGASGVMKLAGKLMKLIHLAEHERRKADAQREVRMAEETGSTRREAGAGQTGGENVANQTMNLKVLQQQVLDSILQKLEEQRWRRDDPDGPNVGS